MRVASTVEPNSRAPKTVISASEKGTQWPLALQLLAAPRFRLVPNEVSFSGTLAAVYVCSSRVCEVPFVTGPYCDINPLYLANTSCTYSCSGCSERCLSWVDLEVNCCWSVPILYIKKFPPTHPGEVDCRPPLAVWCVFASAIEQYSPSQKDLCAGLELVVVALD